MFKKLLSTEICMTSRNWRVLLLLFIICFVPSILNANDRVHHYFTNNSAQSVTIQVVYLYANPADSASGAGTCTPSSPSPNSSCSGSYTVASGTTLSNFCSFLIDDAEILCPVGTFQFGTYNVNGVQLSDAYTWSINDQVVGSLILDSGTNSSLHDAGGGEYNLTYTYGGSTPPPPPPVMTLPVTAFNGFSQGAPCAFPNVSVLNPLGPITVSGSGASASGSTCTGGTSSCTFSLNVPFGSQGTASVSNGITNVPIQVSCTQPPMSLPVTAFNGNSQGAPCTFANTSVLNPHGLIAVSGSGASASNSTCSGGLASCTFSLNVPLKNQGTATVTDGVTNIPIQVSCLPPPPMTLASTNIGCYPGNSCAVTPCSSFNPECCGGGYFYNIYVNNSAGTVMVLAGSNFSTTFSSCSGPQTACNVTLNSAYNIGGATATVTDGVTSIPISLLGCN